MPNLGELALFVGCDDDELARIARWLTPVLVPADHLLIQHDVAAREFAVIADGEVSVTDLDGRELAVLGPGAIVGELGLLRDRPTCAAVRTLTPVAAYAGNRQEFTAMLDASSTVRWRVLDRALART